MCLFLVTALLSALATSALARISPYDPTSNRRPDNITGLNYFYYSNTGSYYNGTITIQLHLKDRNVDEDDVDLFPGNVCENFINNTIDISYNALVAIAKQNPTGSDIPFILTIHAWDKAFDLSRSSKNYSEYQEFSFQTSQSEDTEIFWNLALQNSTPTSYSFVGNRTTELFTPDLMFNLTQPCGDGSVDKIDEEGYLFTGAFLMPELYDPSMSGKWTDSVPIPRIQGSFDNLSAWIDINALFSITSSKSQTQLVGSIDVNFQGNIDALQSDQALFGKDKPEWNATLGFSVASVIDGKSAGARLRLNRGIACTIGILVSTLLFV